jgi:hypothetical protein
MMLYKFRDKVDDQLQLNLTQMWLNQNQGYI